MNKRWLGVLGLAVIPLLLGCTPSLLASAGSLEGQASITLRSASHATIAFTTQNGRTVDGVPPQTSYIPHLVLYRNGALTPADERALSFEVGGIAVPPGGITVSLTIETQHSDPEDAGFHIPVWDAALWVPNMSATTRADGVAVFTVVFSSSVRSGFNTVPTPTDYFRYRVAVIRTTDSAPSVLYEADYAFLLENQIVAALPQVQESTAGAAPDELVIYYCDMFPFQEHLTQGFVRLSRDAITNYVLTELTPRMVEAFRVQTDDWGFPWYEAWTPYREDEAERLSVALSDEGIWFHGSVPAAADSKITINVNGMTSHLYYDSLPARIMGLYQHELFHNLQRNLALHYGGKEDVAGPYKDWQFFTEGTAVLASSVGEPEAEFANGGTHISHVNTFIGGGGLEGQLNTSYQGMDGRSFGVYWRFLFEQCGGMQVVRQALIALYAGDIVDIESSGDLISALPLVMDRAFAGTQCSFATYRDSLVGFARALYALNVQGGRCTVEGEASMCDGLYDPHYLYCGPEVARLRYDGVPFAYTGASLSANAPEQPRAARIPGSFGMDFIEIDLTKVAGAEPLTLEIYGEPGSAAEFRVQVWELGGNGWYSTAIHEPVTLIANAQGRLLHTFYTLDTRVTQRLAIILTRVDTQEQVDPVGAYTVTVY